MSRVNLPLLMMKLSCDRAPGHRQSIVQAHLDLFSKSDLEYCFWELIGACPDQIDTFLRNSSESSRLGLARIKKLMTHYYEHFKTSDYFQEKFLFYPSIGEVDPLRKVRLFCEKPTSPVHMNLIYATVDVRVERIVRKALPQEYRRGLFAAAPTSSAHTLVFRDYDNQVAEYRQAIAAEKLTHWRGAVLLQISLGRRWTDAKHLAATFHTTPNSDVRGVDKLIRDFCTVARPVKPVGWYAFDLPHCQENYDRMTAILDKKEQLKRHPLSRAELDERTYIQSDLDALLDAPKKRACGAARVASVF